MLLRPSANSPSDLMPTHTPGPRMFTLRLNHGYAQVDHDTVWSVISGPLPQLVIAVDALLKSLE